VPEYSVFIYYSLPNIADTLPIIELNFSFNDKILSKALSNKSGKFKNFKVCPVGAVSKIKRSYSILSTEFISSEKLIASSIPGMEVKISLIKFEFFSSPITSFILSELNFLALGSISSTHRFSMPLTLVALSPLNF